MKSFNEFLVAGLVLLTPFYVLSQGLELNNITVKNHKDNVLRKEISFATAEENALNLVWWNKAEPSQLHRLASSSKGKNHRFIVKFLKANSEYGWYAETADKKTSKHQKSKTYHFTTDALPEDLPRLSLEISPAWENPGYVMANYKGERSYLYMFDFKANIVWYEYIGRSIRPFTISRGGNVLGIRNNREFFEIDFEGNTLWSMKIPDGDTVEMIHHEIVEDPEGIIFTLGVAKQTFDLRSIGGKSDVEVSADKIIGIDREGNKKFEWELFDSMKPKDDPGMVKSPGDWGHANGLALDANGDILISFRLFDQVWKVNRSSGEVEWKLGKDGNFEMDESAYFLKQHTPNFTREGHLVVFDNGDKKGRQYSRILVFRINEKLYRARLTQNPIVLSEELSTLKRGSAYPVEDGNFLVCSSGAKSFFLLNNKGEVLWKVQSDKPAYRARLIKKF